MTDVSQLEISAMGCEELVILLKEKFQWNDSVLKTFLEEEIDGEAYLDMTETIMATKLKLKAGQILKILRHQKLLLQGPLSTEVATAVKDRPPVVQNAPNASSPRNRDVKFDVKGTLEKTQEGRKVIEEYNKYKSIRRNKDILVQLSVGMLIDKVNGSLYPSSEMKVALAKAIVTDFPGVHSGNDALHGCDAFFTGFHRVDLPGGKVRKVSASGYIEERLKTLRTKLSPSKKAHRKHCFKINAPLPEANSAAEAGVGFDMETTRSIRRLKHEALSPDEIDTIMMETFDDRVRWIRAAEPPVREIFSNFPPLKISREFSEEFHRLQPESSDFFVEWARVAPMVIKYAQTKTENSDVEKLLDELHNGGQGLSQRDYLPSTSLTEEYAMYLLPHIMGPPMKKGRKKPTCQEVADSIITIFPVGTPVEDIVTSNHETHPRVVGIGSRGMIDKAYLLVEDLYVETPSVIGAIDKAFKLHYICNIVYHEYSSHVWQMIQNIFKVVSPGKLFTCVYDILDYIKRNQLLN